MEMKELRVFRADVSVRLDMMNWSYLLITVTKRFLSYFIIFFFVSSLKTRIEWNNCLKDGFSDLQPSRLTKSWALCQPQSQWTKTRAPK